MSADSGRRHPEVDAEVIRILGTDASGDSFDYHLMRLFILIDRTVSDKELAYENAERDSLSDRGLAQTNPKNLGLLE